VDVIKPTLKSEGRLPQGMMVVNDYIVMAYSAGGGYYENIMRVYKPDGEYVYTIRVNKNYEIENIYMVGNQAYATLYRSYNKPFQKTITKTKWVKKKVKGKKRWVKVKYKQKKTYYKFWRANYIYKVNGI
jgi:hypothetical protein